MRLDVLSLSAAGLGPARAWLRSEPLIFGVWEGAPTATSEVLRPSRIGLEQAVVAIVRIRKATVVRWRFLPLRLRLWQSAECT